MNTKKQGGFEIGLTQKFLFKNSVWYKQHKSVQKQIQKFCEN